MNFIKRNVSKVGQYPLVINIILAIIILQWIYNDMFYVENVDYLLWLSSSKMSNSFDE